MGCKMMGQNEQNEITWTIDGIEIVVQRKSVKNLNLHVKTDGRVIVSVPKRMSNQQIEEFLYGRLDWIKKGLEKYAGNTEKEIDANSITEDEMEHLRRKVILLARKWEPIMGVHCKKWSVRRMNTRWGSCSVQSKTIRMNATLARKTEECVEYVVVHELTHLLEASHNQVFQNYMTQFLPDWRERKKLLNSPDSWI